MHKLSDMIASLPRPFSRDPIPAAALSVRLPSGANWVVQDKVLYTSVGVGQTSLRVDLRGKTLQQVADSINAQSAAGYSCSVIGGGLTTTAALTSGSSLSGFSAYRQPPTLGLARNLVLNGGFLSGSYGWTLSGVGSIQGDATSVTGYALRHISTAGGLISYQDIPVEAGKVYSFAAWSRADGTNQFNVDVVYLDAQGTQIAGVTDTIRASASAAWGEGTATNRTAPGNARTARMRFYGAFTTGTGYCTGMRAVQQATAVAAWAAAHQQYLTRGIDIYDAATQLLANGDLETALSGTVSAFDDQFADLNAWTLDTGSAFTLASNLVSNAAGGPNRMKFGHTEWWDHAAGSRVRFKWVTGGSFQLLARWVDANNYVSLTGDGANFQLQKVIAGASTAVNTQTATLVNGNFYWYQWTVTGTSWAATLDNDNAGAPGTNVATITAQTISDAAVQTAGMAVQMSGGTGMQMGGNFADVCLLKIAAPPNWSVITLQGTPSFCVSKATRFAGTYALSILNNHSAANGHWMSTAVTLTNALAYQLSGRMKTLGVGSTGAHLTYQDGANSSPDVTGTNDWAPCIAVNRTGAGVAKSAAPQLIGVGTAWWDAVWLAQQAYDTGNSDLSGQAYSTGARTATALQLPLPASFNIADCAILVATRVDFLTATKFPTPFQLSYDANNYLILYFNGTTGAFAMKKAVAAATTDVSISAGSYVNGGDTIVGALKFSSVGGMTGFVSKNGGAVTTAIGASTTVPTGTTLTLRIGNDTNSWVDGTIGVVRILRPATAAAAITALMADPYQAPTSDDATVWTFDGAVSGLAATNVATGTGIQASYSLVEGQYSDPSGAGTAIPIHTSPTYQVLAPIALGLDNLNDDLQEGFQQTTLTSADGPWLDHWGRLFGSTRLAAESDLNYARRINGSALIAKTNGFSIIQMLKKIAQIDATITSEGGAAFTITTTLSDSAGTTYDTSAMAIFIRDWKALGVIATVNFQTSGTEVYASSAITDAFSDSFIGGGPGGWASPEFSAKEEGG